MAACVFDGTKIRDQVLADLKDEIVRLATQAVRPSLAAVLVGENLASQLYVKARLLHTTAG